MSNQGHYTASANCTATVETYGTEKGAEREFKKKIKIITAVAKALGVEIWVDEILVEE